MWIKHSMTFIWCHCDRLSPALNSSMYDTGSICSHFEAHPHPPRLLIHLNNIKQMVNLAFFPWYDPNPSSWFMILYIKASTLAKLKLIGYRGLWLWKTLWTIAQGLASNSYQYAGLYEGNVDTVVWDLFFAKALSCYEYSRGFSLCCRREVWWFWVGREVAWLLLQLQQGILQNSLRWNI